MLFGKSVFQSVLDRMETEDPAEPATAAATPYRVSGLTTGFVVEGSGNEIPTAAHVEVAYLDFAGDEPATEAVAPPIMPEHLARLAPEEIAADLALSDTDTVPTLVEKRRVFAKTNHPDGVSEQFRENANIRMTIANQLIDAAMRRLEIRR